MRTLLVLTCIYGINSWDIVLKGPDRVKIGHSFSLVCNATDLETKPESIVWFKGYVKLLPDDRISVTNIASPKTLTSKVTVNHVTKQDEGKYKCWLSNEMIRQINVVVIGRPHSAQPATTTYIKQSTTSRDKTTSLPGADSGAIDAQIPTVSNLIVFIIFINWLGRHAY